MPLNRSTTSRPSARGKARALSPMLATLSNLREFARAGSDTKWVFERKLDGFRALAFRSGGRAELRSRSGQDFTPRYPEIMHSLLRQPIGEFIIDGEIVAFDGSRVSFQQLQKRTRPMTLDMVKRSRVRVAYFVFDLLELNGIDARTLPLLERKRALKHMLACDDVVHYTPHRSGNARELLAGACNKGWEGLIAKDASSPYIGGRTRYWLKLKCSRRQEFVVGGYTDPQGSRNELGALLVGYYDKGRLRYAGKVGTGFNEHTLRELGQAFRELLIDKSPFAPDPALPRRTVHWVKPELVAEIEFFEWTADGKLRHPQYLGLRPDKSPREVVREE